MRQSRNEKTAGVTRREFVKLSLTAGVALGAGRALAWAANVNGIPYRTLGSTGEKVSAIGLGGAHIGRQPTEAESIEIIRTALDNGINFLDNSWDYNGGASEIRMGKALRDGYRKKAFLMTKFDGRDKKTAEKQINQSLSRLQTDHVDLLQIHEVIRMSDPERVFAKGGAIEALQEAQKAGKTRYVGFTGHKSPEIHLKMLATAAEHHFRFDTVQMPLNVMDEHFDSFQKLVLPVLLKQKIGVLGMKPMGSGVILKSGVVTAPECLDYALTLPTDVVITGCDSPRILQQALTVARTFRPMNQAQVAALLAKTASVAQNGQYELYKTSHHFDSTFKNPQYLG